MATVDLTVANAAGHQTRRGVKNAYTLQVQVTGAAAAAAKGSALAATDIIQAIDLPADTLVIGATAKMTTADTGTTLTFDIGTGGGDTFVDGGDGTTAGYLAEGTNGKLSANGEVVAAADTLDITVATASSANDDWVMEVTAFVMDITPVSNPGSA